MTLSLVLRLTARDWRAGELRLLLAALLVAVGTVSAISLFVDRLHRALLAESATFLAADAAISSSFEFPEAFREAARAADLGLAETIGFPSMVFAEAPGNFRSQLAGVKAVAEDYPLRGILRVAEAPFGEATVTRDTPERGEVWLDSRLFPALGVAPGDQVSVGYEKFIVRRALVSEPDRGGGLFAMGPRLLMHIDDVPATRVIQPGSRIDYRLLLAGDDEALKGVREAIEDQLRPNYRWISAREASPFIERAVGRAESFLLLGGLLAVLLAGIAVALGANRYARRHFDHVGVLKTLGATPRSILAGYLGLLSLVGVLGVALGLVLGVLAHQGILIALGSFIPTELPLPGARPFLVGAITGLICLLAFAAPPLVALRRISPMRVIRRDLPGTTASTIGTYGCAAAGALGLLVWYSGDVFLTFWLLIGGVGVSVVFAALALVLLRGGRTLGMQAGSGWRLALAGLQRRYRENTAQIVVFGFAIMLLLILLLVRTSLIDEWQAQIPENTPNHFVLNVTPEEKDDVDALLRANADYEGPLFPMMRGRIVAVNGVDAAEFRRQRWAQGYRMDDDDDDEGPSPDDIAPQQADADGEEDEDGDGRRGGRGFGGRNLTFATDLPENNVVVGGEWWTPDSTQRLVSLEDEYAERRGFAVGDELTFDIGGLPMVATVSNLRRVEWDSLQPNFFVILSPGALEGFPATYMTSFHLPARDKRFLNELIAAHPTITVIEIDAIIRQVQSIVDRVTGAVELVLYLVLASGALVLTASIQASRDQRMKEHALLRALGGTRRLIGGALAAEFAVLGAFAGIVAVIGAEVSVFSLETQVFDLGYTSRPWFWLVGPLFGAALISTVGVLATRRLVNTPPATVLREL